MFIDAVTHLSDDSLLPDLGYKAAGSTQSGQGLFRKIEIVETGNVQEMKDKVVKLRKKAVFIGVRPLEFAVAREASRFSLVDAIIDPYVGRRDIGVDHITMKFASENNVAIALTFYQLLMSHRKDRIRNMRSMEKIIMLAEKYKTPIILTSGAREKYELRGPRELMSMGIILGMSFQNAQQAVSSIPEQMFERNQKKIEGKMFGEVMEYGEA